MLRCILPYRIASLLTGAQVLTGDMLLAAAFVSYAGPFTSKFRALLIADWIRFLREKGAPMTPGITDPLKVPPLNLSKFL